MGEPIESEDGKGSEGDKNSDSGRKGSEPSDESADLVPEVPKFSRERQRTRTRTISRSVYQDSEGNPISKDIVADMTIFQVCLHLKIKFAA